MEKPDYPAPFEIVYHGSTFIYGTLDAETVQGIERARAIDHARHVKEWLDYYSHIANKVYERALESTK